MKNTMTGNYILDDAGHPVPEFDILRWAAWFERASRDGTRILLRTQVGVTRVSTVFLGINHNFGTGTPLLWETCVFDAPDDGDHMRRYRTREEAETGHQEVVDEIRELLTANPVQSP